MTGYLQSQDEFKDRLMVGHSEDQLSEMPAIENIQAPLLGTFSSICGDRVYFYRWNGSLRLRIGDKKPIDLSGVSAKWQHQGKIASFKLFEDGICVVEKRYELNANILNLRDDPTPFAEAEDFDLYLFITNVLCDVARSKIIYR